MRLKGFFTTLFTNEDTKQRRLIDLESKIGRQLFGPIPAGHRREFFYLDEHTWVWFEEWTDASGKLVNVTTRYEIQPRGILKAQDGRNYSYLNKAETENFMNAIRLYHKYVKEQIYTSQATTA